MILKSVRAPDQGQTSVFGKHCLPVCSALAFYTMQGLCFERKMDMPEHSGKVCVTPTVGAGLQWCLVQKSLPLLRCPSTPKLVLLQRWYCNCCMLMDGLVSCITSGPEVQAGGVSSQCCPRRVPILPIHAFKRAFT